MHFYDEFFYVVTLIKDQNNKIGITIGGGKSYYPIIFVSELKDPIKSDCDQVFFNVGDEITHVNNRPVKGKTNVEVANIIRHLDNNVVIQFIPLEPIIIEEFCASIWFKKLKQRFVEKISFETADFLGISRAVLKNDKLAEKTEKLNKTVEFVSIFQHKYTSYVNLINDLTKHQNSIANVISKIGTNDPFLSARTYFMDLSQKYFQLLIDMEDILKKLKTLIPHVENLVKHIIPDTKESLQKYLDVKIDYLAYNLKIKEFEDEENEITLYHDPFNGLEQVYLEHRATLRKCYETKKKFYQLRKEMFYKLELLDQKLNEEISKVIIKWNNLLNDYIVKSIQTIEQMPRIDQFDPTQDNIQFD